MDANQAMDPRYVAYMATVLGVLGGGLQWLRANGVRDRMVFFAGLGIALTGWALFANWGMAKNDPRLFAILSIIILPGCLGSVMGGTYLTSKAASAIVNSSSTPEGKAKLAANPLVPVTDNKSHDPPSTTENPTP